MQRDAWAKATMPEETVAAAACSLLARNDVLMPVHADQLRLQISLRALLTNLSIVHTSGGASGMGVAIRRQIRSQFSSKLFTVWACKRSNTLV